VHALATLTGALLVAAEGGVLPAALGSVVLGASAVTVRGVAAASAMPHGSARAGTLAGRGRVARPGARGDDVRPGRPRLRSPARRGRRLPAHGRRARASPGRRPHGGGRGVAARAADHAAADRALRARPEPDPAAAERFAELSERELEILRLLARRRSNAELGRELFLSEATVKTPVTRILHELGLRLRGQAVVVAFGPRPYAAWTAGLAG